MVRNPHGVDVAGRDMQGSRLSGNSARKPTSLVSSDRRGWPCGRSPDDSDSDSGDEADRCDIRSKKTTACKLDEFFLAR